MAAEVPICGPGVQEEIFSSSFAAAAYLQSRKFDKNKKVSPAASCQSATMGRDLVLVRLAPSRLAHGCCGSTASATPAQEGGAAQVYVIGDVGILEELDLHGYQYFGGPEDGSKKVELSAGYAMPHDENVRPGCRGWACRQP